MQINVYVNNNGSFTVNVFDNDGYVAGSLTRGSTGVTASEVVEFIDKLRNQEPENVRARICMGGATQDKPMDMFSSCAGLYVQLLHAAQEVQNVLVGA